MAETDPGKKTIAWRLVGWFWLASGLAIGFWWLFHLPSAGYGGLALAMGATLMPLVWEKVGLLCKMGWIAMLFVLLFVEYRAIDKDRRDSSEMLTRKFGEVSEQANQNLKKILEDEHLSFAKSLEAENKRFSQTIATILSSQKKNEKEFATLLRQQRDIFDKEDEMIESANGHLLPSSDRLPSLAELGRADMHSDSEDYFLVVGNIVNIVHEFPYVLLRVHGADVITFDKLPSGLLVLTMDMRDSSGNIISRFDTDGFEVGTTLLKRHPDKSTLIVEDSKGNRILRARYNNSRLFTFEGNGALTIGGNSTIGPWTRNPDPNGGTCIGHSGHGINLN
jgi:hypothetical protein